MPVRGQIEESEQRMIRYAIGILLLSTAATSAQPPSLPPMADEAIGTIVSVLRAAESCNKVDELQNAIQPLLFLLGHLEGRDADRVLAKLQWYQLGQVNAEVYDCIVIERGMRRRDFRDQLSSTKDDCRVQLGAKSALCLSTSEVAGRRARLLKSISNRKPCEALP
jgi:hypothetical protein